MAQLSSEALEHARSAFLFIKRGDWDNANEHAKASDDAVLEKLVAWQYALQGDSASFDDITSFMTDNPDWPDQKKLRIRAELSLKDGKTSDKDIIAWFGDDPPITGVGKIALAEALMRSKAANRDKIDSLIREAWKGGDFDEPQEKEILEKYGNVLRHEDDIGRIDRLLWEEKISVARRMLKRVPDAYQKLYKARMALIEDKKISLLAVLQVPKALKTDPGLMYDRMRYRARRGDDKGVREILLAAPMHVPYPEKWWKQREVQIREAISEKNYAMASKLLANHGQIENGELADAIWLEGWLKCEFTQQPKEAYQLFYRMTGVVKYPVSKARAGYWAARAAEKSGDSETAAKWYAAASAYPTTFYGQLAALHRDKELSLQLPQPPAISAEDKDAFEKNELAQAIALCIELNEIDLAKHLAAHLVENAPNDGIAALVAELGMRKGMPYLSVRGAKKALQNNVVLIKAGYPLPRVGDLSVEKPLALAITRQESEFDPHAQSPSGAIGMMQLLPSTAKETAKKKYVSYSEARLYEPEYNMTLGSLYLERLVSNYDGSYIMAIAAYNGGPGNVRKWADAFGTPGNNVDNAVNWIEKIPFHETRNYVQRVMENLEIYRCLEAEDEAPKLEIGKDLVR